MNGHFILTKPGRLNKSFYKSITKKKVHMWISFYVTFPRSS